MHSAQWGCGRQKRGQPPGARLGAWTLQRALKASLLIVRRDVGDNIRHTKMVCSTADPVHVKVQEIHKYGPVRVAVPNQSPHPSFLSAKRSYYLCVSKPKSGMLQIEWKSSVSRFTRTPVYRFLIPKSFITQMAGGAVVQRLRRCMAGS